MDTSAPAPGRSLLSDDDLFQSLSLMALELSRIRKAQAILAQGGPMRFLDVAYPSTDAECIADWNHASAALTDQLMWRRGYELDRMADACWRHFEGVWLDDIKRYLAYMNWLNSGGAVWSTAAAWCGHYYQACDGLRDRLVNPNLKQPAHIRVVQRLQAIRNDIVLMQSLIQTKAARAGSATLAAAFVDGFYSNIVAAIGNNRDAIIKVLRALQHGGGAPGGPELVNGMETALAVAFLNADVIQDCWQKQTDGITRATTL